MDCHEQGVERCLIMVAGQEITGVGSQGKGVFAQAEMFEIHKLCLLAAGRLYVLHLLASAQYILRPVTAALYYRGFQQYDQFAFLSNAVGMAE